MLPLTKLDGIPDRREVVNGMAHFAGTGPVGECCKGCKHYGYSRESRYGNLYRVQACAKFKKLTGKYGSRLRPRTPACRYFENKVDLI